MIELLFEGVLHLQGELVRDYRGFYVESVRLDHRLRQVRGLDHAV